MKVIIGIGFILIGIALLFLAAFFYKINSEEKYGIQ